eukprot:594013-Rhodomonas_salina.2
MSISYAYHLCGYDYRLCISPTIMSYELRGSYGGLVQLAYLLRLSAYLLGHYPMRLCHRLGLSTMPISYKSRISYADLLRISPTHISYIISCALSPTFPSLFPPLSAALVPHFGTDRANPVLKTTAHGQHHGMHAGYNRRCRAHRVSNHRYPAALGQFNVCFRAACPFPALIYRVLLPGQPVRAASHTNLPRSAARFPY